MKKVKGDLTKVRFPPRKASVGGEWAFGQGEERPLMAATRNGTKMALLGGLRRDAVM